MFDTDYDYEPYSDDLNDWEEEQVFNDHEGDADLDPAHREFLNEANGSSDGEDEWEDEDGEDDGDEFDADESEDSWLDGSYEG
jgi:hypothetical protein